MSISPVPRIEPLTGFTPWRRASFDHELYPTLSLFKGGFYVNAAAEREYDLDKYTYVRLYWDAATRRMSAKFYPTGDFPGSRKARVSPNGRGRSIACAPFMEDCGITHADYGKYRCTEDSGVACVVVQLRKHNTDVPRNIA